MLDRECRCLQFSTNRKLGMGGGDGVEPSCHWVVSLSKTHG